MKRNLFKIFFTILALLFTTKQVNAVEFNVLVLPTDLFNVCENYFCFTEPSVVASESIIQQLNTYKSISAYSIEDTRATLSQNAELKAETSSLLNNFYTNEKIDFDSLKKISSAFDVKSVILVSAYTVNNENLNKRNLWEILEISSAFNIAHQYTLKTNVVLTDTVNNTVMWSGKYSKNISDNNEYFVAKNLPQAASQLEKLRIYYKDFISQTVCQNIKLRFFPKEVRTVKFNENKDSQPQFMPNALEHLSKPRFEEKPDTTNFGNSTDDFIFSL